MKRILIFSLAYYPRFVGGAEVAIKEITDRMAAGGATGLAGGVAANSGGHEIEFDMITLRFDKSLPPSEKIGNVMVHRIGFAKMHPTDADLLRFPLYLAKVFYAPLAYWKAKKLDRTRHYDALWSMMSYMGFPALFFNAFYARRRKGKDGRIRAGKIPFILTLQEGDSVEHIAGRRRIRAIFFLYKSVFRNATIVQTISHYLAAFARKMGYDGKSEVIPNGVDVKLFTSRLSDTEMFALKTQFDKKYTDTFLITTSRLVPKNAVSDIILALTHLPEEVKLLIIGSGPQEAELRKLVSAQRLDSRVRFLGFIPYAEIPKFLQISDIFVRPSLSEGFGNSFIEAMAAGLPVIATPVGGIVDFLTDKQTGLFCETHDPESIALAVKRLLQDGRLKDAIVQNAKEMVIERYDWDLVAKEMRDRVFGSI